jgi:hypothetical protein
MGWDIVFHARFPEREDPARRFRAIRSALEQRPGVEPLSSFEVLEGGDPLRPLVDLNDLFPRAEPVTEARVEACLSGMSSDSVGFSGIWRKRGQPRDTPTSTAIRVTALGAQARRPGYEPWPVDVVWDLFDSRRYTREGRLAYPTVDEVMADLVVLVELGAMSIWGLDADKVVAPESLYAVFHRDREDYRQDRAEPFAEGVIPEVALRVAIEMRPEVRIVKTSAGPIVYHEDLGGGRLWRFYDTLEDAVACAAEMLGG